MENKGLVDERKIVEKAKELGIPEENIKRVLSEIKKAKRKIRGVWGLRGWMWIATGQPSKYIWEGWVISPIVPKGEFGSWYVWELKDVGAEEIVKPFYRYKLTPEDIERMKEKLRGVI